MSEAAILQSRRAIYVGGIAEEVNSTILRAAFIPFGPVKAIELPMDYAKGIHKSFAFVEFEDPDDAEEAIYNMDGAELMGKTLSVSLAQANQMRQSNKAVWSSDECKSNKMMLGMCNLQPM
jgi:peptidyl-prolyl isomerase E (cyclophilin E)